MTKSKASSVYAVWISASLHCLQWEVHSKVSAFTLLEGLAQDFAATATVIEETLTTLSDTCAELSAC